jgi:hypothetical protein
MPLNMEIIGIDADEGKSGPVSNISMDWELLFNSPESLGSKTFFPET